MNLNKTQVLRNYPFYLQEPNTPSSILVHIAPAIIRVTKTWNLLTFVFMVKMVIVCYLFAGKNLSHSKEDNLRTQKQVQSPSRSHKIKTHYIIKMLGSTLHDLIERENCRISPENLLRNALNLNIVGLHTSNSIITKNVHFNSKIDPF